MKDSILAGVRHIHLVGMGGIGMNGLACLLHEKGYQISGSDLKPNDYLKPLLQKGVLFCPGHSAGNISEHVDLVCYSSAVTADNPELQEASRRHIPILKRAELLALLAREKTLLAVAGSHGKTTTTALLSHVLQELGYAPSACIGGVSLNYGRIAWWGKDLFVAEVDESDGSFLYFKPDYAIVTNIDREHLDFYRDEKDIKESFTRFIGGVKKMTFGCGDDANTRQILKQFSAAETYGVSAENSVYAANIVANASGSVYEAVFRKGQRRIVDIRFPLLGMHNVLNSLAVMALLESMGIDPEDVKRTFIRFKGTKRRFQIKADENGVLFVDDYAHHPAEIRATLSSARFFQRRVVAVFEPHRYSRFSALTDEFRSSFDESDVVIVTDIYAASERRLPGTDIAGFCEELAARIHKPVYWVPDGDPQRIASYIQEGDIVVALGAGRISEVLDDVIRGFKKAKSLH